MLVSACQSQPLAVSKGNATRNVSCGAKGCSQQRHWWLQPPLASSPHLDARQSVSWALQAVAQDTLETELLEVSQRAIQPRTRRRHQAAPAIVPNVEETALPGTQAELSVLIDSSKLTWALAAEGTIELRPPDDPLVSSCSNAAQVLLNHNLQQPGGGTTGTDAAEEHGTDDGQLCSREQLVLELPSTSDPTTPDIRANRRSKHLQQKQLQHNHGSFPHVASPTAESLCTAADLQQGYSSSTTTHPRTATASASASNSHSSGLSQQAALTRPRPASADATSAAQQSPTSAHLQHASSTSQGRSTPTHMVRDSSAQAGAQHALHPGAGTQHQRSTGHDPGRATRLQRIRRLLSYSPSQQIALTAPAWVWRKWRLRKRARSWRRRCRMSVSRTSDVDVWGQFLQQQQEQQRQQQLQGQQRLVPMGHGDHWQESQWEGSYAAAGRMESRHSSAWQQAPAPEQGQHPTVRQQGQYQGGQQHQHHKEQQHATAQQGVTACGPLPKQTVAKLLIEVRRLKAVQRQLAAAVAASSGDPPTHMAHQQAGQGRLHRHSQGHPQQQQQQQQQRQRQRKPGLYAQYSTDGGITWHMLPMSTEAGADGQQLIALGVPAQAATLAGSGLPRQVSRPSATAGSQARVSQQAGGRQQGPDTSAQASLPVLVRLHGHVPCGLHSVQQQEGEQEPDVIGCTWSSTLQVPEGPGSYVVQLSVKQSPLPPLRRLFSTTTQLPQHKQQEQSQHATGASSSQLSVVSEATRVLQQSTVMVADVALLAGRKSHAATDDAACGQLSRLWASSQAVQPSMLVYTTHRSWRSFQQLWRERQHVMQAPDVVICGGGTAIMYRLADGSWRQDQAWHEQLEGHASRGWDRSCVVEAAQRAAARYNLSGTLSGAAQLQLGVGKREGGTALQEGLPQVATSHAGSRAGAAVGAQPQLQQGQSYQEPQVIVKADTRKEQSQHRVRLLVRAPQAAGFAAALQAELESSVIGARTVSRGSATAGELHWQQLPSLGVSNGQHHLTAAWAPPDSLPAGHAVQVNGHRSVALRSRLFAAVVCNGEALATTPALTAQPSLAATSLIAGPDCSRSGRASAVAVAPQLATVAVAEVPAILAPASIAVASPADVVCAPMTPPPSPAAHNSHSALPSQHPASSNGAAARMPPLYRLQAQVMLQSPASLGCGSQWAAVDVVPPGVSTASALQHVLQQWGITPSPSSMPLVYAATAPDPAIADLATHVIAGGRHGQRTASGGEAAGGSGFGGGVAGPGGVSEPQLKPTRKGKGAGSKQAAHGKSRELQSGQHGSALTVQPGVPGAQAVLQGLEQLGLL